MSLTASAHSVPGTLRQNVVIDGRHHIVTDEPRASEATDPPPRRTSFFRPPSPRVSRRIS